MKVGYVSTWHEQYYGKKIISVVYFDVMERKNIKNELSLIMTKDEPNPIKITKANVKRYQLFLTYFLKRDDLQAFYMKTIKRGTKKETEDIFQIIKNLNGEEPVRFYIPFSTDKTQLHNLNKQVQDNGLNVKIEEIKKEESPYSRLADLLGFCILAYDRICETAMDDTAKELPEEKQVLANYLMCSKKDKKKLKCYMNH